MKTMNVSDTLAMNINLAREDDEFLNVEKASIADALYGISVAKANFDDNRYILEKLDAAENIITGYLFHLDIFAEK